MCGCNIANKAGAPVQMKVSQGLAMRAVLTIWCSCFKDLLGDLTLFVLECTGLMEKECGLKSSLVLDGVLGCEGHGDKVSSFPLTDFRAWHTERTNFIILTSFFRFTSLSFPPLP